MFYVEATPDPDALAEKLHGAVPDALRDLAARLPDEFDAKQASVITKEVLLAHGLKMPQLAMPVRVLVMGTAQTPSLDAVLELQDRKKVLVRLQNG